jgi:hypothetical protein
LTLPVWLGNVQYQRRQALRERGDATASAGFAHGEDAWVPACTCTHRRIREVLRLIELTALAWLNKTGPKRAADS